MSDPYTRHTSLLLVKLEVQVLQLRLILTLNCQSNLTNFTLHSIVEFTVVEDQLHIVAELLHLLVLVLSQLLSDRSKVHWLSYYLMVVWDVQGLHIHWLIEDVSLGVLLQIRY